MKTLKVVRALSLALISIGAGYTPYAVAEKMKSINIGVSGYIEAETCSAVSAEGSSFSLIFPAVSLASFKGVNFFVVKNIPGVDIKFSCPSGIYANARFYHKSEKCQSVGGTPMGCGGNNTSVGIAPYVTFDNYDTKKTESVQVQYHDGGLLRKVAVNQNKEGTINIGKEIFLGKVKDRVTEPGDVSIDMVLELWVD